MNAVHCPSCDRKLPAEALNREPAPCPLCKHSIQVHLFPARFKAHEAGSEAEAILTDAEAGCFFHPEKKAAVSCGRCGRFLCSLCDIPLNEEHLCSNCIESGSKKGKIQTLENKRTMYDRLAFGLAFYPVITFIGIIITCVTAPISLYIAIRHRKSPGSLVRQSMWRFYVAGVFAFLQIVGWIIFVLGKTNALDIGI